MFSAFLISLIMITNILFSSSYNIDKIVNIWEGSYDRATSDVRSEPFAGIIYVHKIKHGYDRPLFLTILWSEDNITWSDGGTGSGTEAVLAFSDSQYVYISSIKNTGTLYFKVIGYWINDYDNTNPAIEPFTNNIDLLMFDSRTNYQKIAFEGATTYPAGSFGSSYVVSINHNLGFMPNVKVYFEPIKNEVWPLNSGGTTNPFLYSFSQDEADLRIYDNKIEIDVLRSSNDIRRVWYRGYYDQ